MAHPPLRAARSRASDRTGRDASTLDVRTLRGARALEELREEWRALWMRDPRATPFQSPAWQLAWWRYFGRGEPSAIVLRDAGALVGLATMYVYDGDARPRLVFIGAGNSDRLDALIAPGYERAAARAILDAIAERLGDDLAPCECCTLEGLGTSSPLASTCAPPTLRVDDAELDVCPVLALAPSSLDETVPRSRLRRHRYERRRLERLGATIETVRTPDALGEALDALFALHARRWSARDEPGVLAGEVVRAFHREAASALLDAGALRFHLLRVGGEIIAAHYGFHHASRAYFYLGGFDPAHARLGPGAALVGHAIEEARREGARELDFLRGRERYKYEWGAADRPVVRRVLRRR